MISSKVGKVYLVPYAATPTSKTDLESLDDRFKSSVLYANQVTEMQTFSLTAGEYKVYFVDSEGRMSAPSAKIVLQDNPRITLTNEEESSFLLGKEGAVLKDLTDNPSSADRNINDWIQVKWHGKSLDMIYNSTQHNFKVFEDDNRVGTLEVSSESSVISIEPTEDGLHIRPTEEANETTKADLQFTLKSYSREEETQQELGHVDLPVHFDLAPSVTEATYQDGVITLTVDQVLHQMDVLPLVKSISYSSSGEFGNDNGYLLQDEEFKVALSEDPKQFTITLTDSVLNELLLNENGKFRLVISGLRDETGNLSEEETYDVNISNVEPNPTSKGE